LLESIGGNSYVRVLKGDGQTEDKDVEKSLAIVLDDECLMTRDLSKSILGRVKVFASLANLKMALCNEGFVDIKIHYMGEFWVMMEFTNKESIKKFQENVSVGSWFLLIKDASLEFQTKKRIVWVEIEGIPFKLWSGNTFNRVAAKWGDLLDVDDQEDTCFHSKRLCIHTKTDRSISKEFKIIHRGKVYWIRTKETPPDFTKEPDDEDQDDTNSNDDGSKDQVPGFFVGDSDVEEVQENMLNEVGQGDNNLEEGELNEKVEKSKDPFNIYRMLNKKVEKGGYDNKSKSSLKYPPGFSPTENNEENSLHGGGDSNYDGEGSNKSKRVEGNEASRINMKSKDDGTDSFSSGNFKNPEIPRTGGSILGLLDEVVKVGQIMGYNMEGCMSNMAKIIEAKGAEEVVVMGDFNEVRYKSDRFRSVFNAHAANMFNVFIMNSGLVEVDLDGCSFTWCHKSASKMSKLDRFLVLESLMNTCPNINAITLERFLYDHRPILLQEAYFDYGPTPFKIFHYWFEMKGFSKTVKDAWKEYPGEESNAVRHFMGKLKYLKNKIQEWNTTSRSSVTMTKAQCKNYLKAIDNIIDKGNGGEEEISKRAEIINKLHDIDNLQSMEIAQKAKIK
nr:nucleotide-binding alpha-beta plait domain-containing protein [Tanacetum cinerariifolium]